MTIQITSTTDSNDSVASAMGAPKTDDKNVEAKPAPEAKSSEQNEEVSDSGTETTEANEGETETESHEEGEIEAKEGQEGQPPKKKGGFQRRIDKLNTRVTAAQQEAEYWKQQALKGASATETKPVVESAKPATEGKPKPDSFDTHAEYVEALTDWKVDQKQKEHDQKLEQSRIQAEQAKVANTYAERAKVFGEKTKDFQDVLSDVDHVPMSPTVRDIFLTSENGPELAYELAKDPEEFARVCKLPPLAAAREMGKLELRISSKTPGGQETNKITKAPKPLEPVKAGGKGSAPKSIYDPDLSQAEYEKIRAKQRSAS